MRGSFSPPDRVRLLSRFSRKCRQATYVAAHPGPAHLRTIVSGRGLGTRLTNIDVTPVTWKAFFLKFNMLLRHSPARIQIELMTSKYKVSKVTRARIIITREEWWLTGSTRRGFLAVFLVALSLDRLL